MDILSHGLWGALGTRALNQARQTRLSPMQGFLWGVFPDLFAFVPALAWLAWQMMTGDLTLNDLPRGNPSEPPDPGSPFALASTLYLFSHSLIIFLPIFLLIYRKNRSIALPMLAWAFHILCDIPTHDIHFYPTPFLWPLSAIRVDGFSWSHTWFMGLNYGALAFTYLWLHSRATPSAQTSGSNASPPQTPTTAAKK